MSQSVTDNQNTNTCVSCGQQTSYPMELNEKMYCSSGCISKYRAEVGERQFEKDSLATFEKKRDTGWIPERALMYINMCQRCSKELKTMCKSNQYVSGLNREELRKHETVPWCCHARFNLSSSMSDGTVPLESALKMQAMAELLVKDHNKCFEVVKPESLRKKMAKEGGLKGVTTTIIDIAAAETAINPEYKKEEDIKPILQPLRQRESEVERPVPLRREMGAEPDVFYRDSSHDSTPCHVGRKEGAFGGRIPSVSSVK